MNFRIFILNFLSVCVTICVVSYFQIFIGWAMYDKKKRDFRPGLCRFLQPMHKETPGSSAFSVHPYDSMAPLPAMRRCCCLG